MAYHPIEWKKKIDAPSEVYMFDELYNRLGRKGIVTGSRAKLLAVVWAHVRGSCWMGLGWIYRDGPRGSREAQSIGPG